MIWWLLVVLNGQASVSDPLTLEECVPAAIVLKHMPEVEYADCFRIVKKEEPPKRPQGLEA
jgi:uncharacterized NAD-dependent epimerase/dehydratase family protein